MASQAAPVKKVDERSSAIHDTLSKDTHLDTQALPGLKDLLADYLSPTIPVDQTSFMQRFLHVFKASSQDTTYQEFLAKYTPDEQQRLEQFVQGADPKDVANGFQDLPNLGTREELAQMAAAPKATISATGTQIEDAADNDHTGEAHDFRDFVNKIHGFFHDLFHTSRRHENHGVAIYKKAIFQNWGRTVHHVPEYTVVPTSVAAVERIVRYAKAHNMSVRCSGYRHSWSPIFGREGHIMISMLPISTATRLPNLSSLPLPEAAGNELETIGLVGQPSGNGKQLVRVGCAVTSERLRRFCIANGKVTMPMNVIMVEITLGGSNAPICHGAGRNNKTLSDLVRKVEYVDANGQLQAVSDPAQLKAAAGCFGLMGVVTHLTLELDPLTYAQMRPAKIPVIAAIPPPPEMRDYEILPALRPEKPLTADDKAKAQQRFEEMANDYYYAEWFWFPYSDNCWVNCWNTTTDATDVVSYPSDVTIFLIFAETFTMNVIQYAPVMWKLVEATGMDEAAVTLFSSFAMMNMLEVKDNGKPIKAALPNAIHFIRASQKIRVRDLEVEMPLQPSKADPKRVDYSLVQRAWWDAILKCYQHSDKCPQRFPLEMRIMSDSDMIMAPQRGNKLGTCSIEVVTLENASTIWQPYAQELADKWMSYTDADGKRLKSRPHWAKEWYALSSL